MYEDRLTTQDSQEISLDRRLKQCSSTVHASVLMKRRMRANLMRSIDSVGEESRLYAFGQSLRNLSKSIHMPSALQMMMRRKVLRYALLNEMKKPFGYFDFILGTARARVAFAMVLVILMTSVMYSPGISNVAYAQVSTLHDVEGDVYIYRDGVLSTAYDGYILKEGDRVHTGHDSNVTAIFANETISRIAQDSRLNISELDADSSVVVGMPKGRIWSRVNNPGSGAFTVATLHTLVKATRKVTFDIQASEDLAQVSVLENFVDVELSSYSPSVVKTVVEGASLVVNRNQNRLIAVNEDDEWLKLNISKDEYESQLMVQKDASELESEIGTLPTDPLYQVKTLTEDLNVVLSINDREKLAQQLAHASKRLAEAEVLINKGLRGSAEKVLKEYKEVMLSLLSEYPQLSGITDAQEKLTAIIDRDRRRYNTTLPGSSLYDVKKVVNEVELLLANDQVRANQIAYKQASDELYQVFELMKVGGEVLAKSSLDNYLYTFNATFGELAQYSQSDKTAYIDGAVQVALRDIKTLHALQEAVKGTDMYIEVFTLKNSVVSALKKLVTAINDDGSYDYVIADMDMILAPSIYELVKDSSFTGVSETNAYVVGEEIEVQTESEEVPVEKVVSEVVDEMTSEDVIDATEELMDNTAPITTEESELCDTEYCSE